MFLHKNLFFFNIFCYFNPNHAYWNQRRLFSGNLPGMFLVFCSTQLQEILLQFKGSIQKESFDVPLRSNKTILCFLSESQSFIGADKLFR